MCYSWIVGLMCFHIFPFVFIVYEFCSCSSVRVYVGDANVMILENWVDILVRFEKINEVYIICCLLNLFIYINCFPIFFMNRCYFSDYEVEKINHGEII